MIFRQITHDDLGCASYFIGDYDAGVAAVVDPRLEIGPYLELARYLSVEIAHVLETHNHADHVSGHGRLAAATGAPIHIHRDAKPDYDHEPFDHGWRLDLGPLVSGESELLPLTPRQVDQKRRDGVMIVDVRIDLQFDDAHIPGAVSNTMLHAGFGTKLAWIADRDQEIVLVGRDDDDARGAARLASAVGIRKLGGFLSGGMTSWRDEQREVERIERIRADELRERVEADPGVQILD